MMMLPLGDEQTILAPLSAANTTKGKHTSFSWGLPKTVLTWAKKATLNEDCMPFMWGKLQNTSTILRTEK